MYRSTPINRGTLMAGTLCASILLSLCAILGGAHAQSDDERLQDFLDRLGLLDLQATHLEQRLSVMPAGDPRTQLARRLADLYAQQLTESLSNSARYGELSERVQKLLEMVPEARTAALEVMLLQVDYQRAESLIRQWLSEPDEQSARQDAQTVLQRITPRLKDQYEQLWQRANEQLAIVERGGSNVELAERELLRRQSIAARAAYFTGWSSYYRGILATPVNREDVQEAHALFRQLLELSDDDKYSDFDADALALESPWRARALVGLGMSEAALGNVTGSIECFRIVNQEVTAAEVRDQANYWCVQALLLSGNPQAALNYARPHVEALAGEPTEGKVSFCVALVRGGSRDAAMRDSDIGRQLSNLGVRGLARLQQYRVLHKLLTKYGVDVDNPQGFLLLWLQGQQRLDKAQASRDSADLEAAAESFRHALASADALADLAAANRCREQLAWCYYNLEKYLEAVREYRQAAEGLKTAGDESAVEAAWMSFVAANKLVEGGGPATTMHDAANWLNQQFPGHDHSKRAMFLAGKMRMRNASPEERLRALKNISPDDPNFSSARQEICAVFYEQWRSATGEQKTESVAQLQQAIDETLSPEYLNRTAPADQLALRLMAVAVALDSSPPNQAAAALHLAASRGLVARSGIDPVAIAEFHYRWLQYARVSAKYDELAEHVSWFLDHGEGTKFESAALISAAKSLDAAAGESYSEPAGLGLRVYRRLTEILGSDRDRVSANRNAQVALSRLAHYAYVLGEREAAASRSTSSRHAIW